MSIATSLKKAGRKIEKAVTGEEPQIDLLDTLKEEHELVGDLLKKLVGADMPPSANPSLAQDQGQPRSACPRRGKSSV